MESLADFLQLDGPTPSAPRQDASADPYSGTATIKEFAEKVLNSQEYRASLHRRIILDELPAQIEALLYYYAAGKPTERVEHTGKNGEPMEVITEVRRVVVAASLSAVENDAYAGRH